jgi:hypothetical protein
MHITKIYGSGYFQPGEYNEIEFENTQEGLTHSPAAHRFKKTNLVTKPMKVCRIPFPC